MERLGIVQEQPRKIESELQNFVVDADLLSKAQWVAKPIIKFMDRNALDGRSNCEKHHKRCELLVLLQPEHACLCNFGPTRCLGMGRMCC